MYDFCFLNQRIFHPFDVIRKRFQILENVALQCENFLFKLCYGRSLGKRLG